uniref:phenylalanine--tRNA ligase n=1 Tax=Caloglossa intermedia TaxID=100879 RepID=A0A1Z1M627_9FLOR|nr:Phenylalanine-tRNA ligase beta subunit [Caloglossa intermedia]ARW61548.1 Phenylalanine-tRNA ligase beta subunit [Caloglossa intermedia]
MKFSWKILNFFIDLKHIKFSTFIEKLNLSGLEAEAIKNNLTTSDTVISLNVTTNRKEIFCIVNLAIEVSIIFNIPLKTKLYPLKLIEPLLVAQNLSSLDFEYIKIHKIHTFMNSSSPKWLQDYLQKCDIQPVSLLWDIQKYIYIKWGHKFFIFNLEKLTEDTRASKLSSKNNNLIRFINELIYNKQDQLFFDHQKKYKYKQDTILCFVTYPVNKYSGHNNQNTFAQAYIEAINLVATYCKTTISKSQEYYVNNLNRKTHAHTLSVKKNEIKLLLGPVKQKKSYYLSNRQISETLKQLKYPYKYLHNYKIFKIMVPNYRQHDLKRNIDLIEEIGRIYGFENFLDKLPKYNKKGNISLQYLQEKKIKNTLNNIGFHEAITSSFAKKIESKLNNIKICNPLTGEQASLRTNIVENLINIHKKNLKNKRASTEIFEIGKIFYKNNSSHFIHEKHLGILVSNNKYIQTDWSNQKEVMNWFHARGTIENFLEIIQANIKWGNYHDLSDSINFKHILKYYHPNKRIFLYNLDSKEIIGVFGEMYNIDTNYTNIKNVYLFEINLSKLLKSINYNKHFNHIIKPYSLYPDVTRDISIRVKNTTSINKIKKLFLKNGINLIESIQVINDYYDKVERKRSICVRIVYRSQNRTLNSTDLKNIDLNIRDILNMLYDPSIIEI